MTYSRAELRFNGWGLARQGFDMCGRDAEVWRFVRESLGVASLPDTPATPLEALSMPDVALTSEDLEALRNLTSPSRVETDRFERAFHALGKSYHDLLRIRAGTLAAAPDAVVYPKGHDEVVALLAACAERRLAVVPFGGGSSVVGGVEARRGADHAGLVTLDLTRMDRLLDLDEASRSATFEAGVYGPALEEALAARGFTLGHFPQSFEFSTLGGWLAARGAGQQSNRYGAAAKLLVGARVATPQGEWRTAPFPNSAAGPDLNHLVAGSEGALGVITEARVVVRRLPETRDFASFLFRDWEAGVEAVRAITQDEVPVSMLRLSDADETRFYGAFKEVLRPSSAQRLALGALGAAGFDEPCVLLVGFEGSARGVGASRRAVLARCARRGGLYVGRGHGHRWYEQRFAMPYLRDPLMDRGVGIDTLETSTEWSNVPVLSHAVRAAIDEALRGEGARPVILTHISHTYLTGTSLYFTFLFVRDRDDPVGQWRAAKEAASRAISEHGGTISHHHGVGTDHAPWLAFEKGPLGVGVLEAAKRRLDPAGIMNPGKLLEAPER
jgi:alkyldihydroxyacetonephosphate synthase